MKIQEIHKLFLKNNSISIDTRTLKKGDMFFGIKGTNFDGNNYLNDALERGASFAVSDNKKLIKNDRIIKVQNSLDTLQILANYHRKFLKTTIIAITGSNGKTTTKELISSVLKQKYNVIATKGNLNNHLGVPITLLSMNIETEIGIVEMGANNLKEIELLCNIAEPDYGYITNFGNAHLEGFKSVEGVIKGKSELYKYLISKNKIIFFNKDDEIQKYLIHNYNKTYSFGTLTKADTIISSSIVDDNIIVKYKENYINSNIYGEYNIDNLSVAISFGEYFNVNIYQIKNGIENYIPNNNRSQVVLKNNNKIILDAYNANPTSMELSIKSFYNLNDSKKILILGDMFELGKKNLEYHQQIINQIESLDFEKIYVVGKNFKSTNFSKKVKSYDTTEKLKVEIEKLNLNNYTILIKGSRGMQLENILNSI